MIKVRYILFGIVCYFMFVVVTLPANVVYAYWKDMFGGNVPVVLQGLNGSIWSGAAAQAYITDKQVEKLQWQFRPLPLILGRVELALEFSLQDGFGKAVVGHSVLGNSYLSDVEAWIPMGDLLPMFNLQSLNAGGSLSLNLTELTVKEKMVTSALGNLTWQDAEITLLKPLPLGSLAVDIEPTDEGIKGVLSDQGGPMSAEGLVTLSPEGQYEINAAVSVRDPQQTDLQNALRSIGPTGADGKTKLKASGDLASLGLF